jgi:predicted nucleotidyltransferase
LVDWFRAFGRGFKTGLTFFYIDDKFNKQRGLIMIKNSDINVDKKKLKDLNIGILYLFGSYSEDTFNPMSDVDIGVVFKNPKTIKENTFKLYNKVYRILIQMFPEHSDDLDIVFLEKASLELQFDVVRHGKVIYGVSKDFRLAYEERVSILYADFYPLLEESNKSILSR